MIIQGRILVIVHVMAAMVALRFGVGKNYILRGFRIRFLFVEGLVQQRTAS